MYIKLSEMFKDNQIMPVTFVVPEEDILTSARFKITPVYFSIFDGIQRRMFVIFEFYGKAGENLV